MSRAPRTIRYTLPEHPDLVIQVPGIRDTEKSRLAALDKLGEMKDEGDEVALKVPNHVTESDFVHLGTRKQDSQSNRLELIDLHINGDPIKAGEILAVYAELKTKLCSEQEKLDQIQPIVKSMVDGARLTPEQLVIAQSGSLPTLIRELAFLKAEIQKLEEAAVDAYAILYPADEQTEVETPNGKGKKRELAAV